MNRLETALKERAGEKNTGNDQKPAETKKPKSSTCTAKPKAKSAAKKAVSSKKAEKKNLPKRHPKNPRVMES